MDFSEIGFHEFLSKDLFPQHADLPADIEDLEIHADDYCKYFREIFGNTQ